MGLRMRFTFLFGNTNDARTLHRLMALLWNNMLLSNHKTISFFIWFADWHFSRNCFNIVSDRVLFILNENGEIKRSHAFEQSLSIVLIQYHSTKCFTFNISYPIIGNGIGVCSDAGTIQWSNTLRAPSKLKCHKPQPRWRHAAIFALKLAFNDQMEKSFLFSLKENARSWCSASQCIHTSYLATFCNSASTDDMNMHFHCTPKARNLSEPFECSLNCNYEF